MLFFRVSSIIFDDTATWAAWWNAHSQASISGLLTGYGFLRLHQSYTDEAGTLHRLVTKPSLGCLLRGTVLIPVSIVGLVVS